MDTKEVAQIVKKTAEIREASYNGERYDLSCMEAAEAACKELGHPLAMGQILGLALDGWWNDALGWADQVLDPTGTCEPTIAQCQHGIEYSVESCRLCSRNLEREVSRRTLNYAIQGQAAAEDMQALRKQAIAEGYIEVTPGEFIK